MATAEMAVALPALVLTALTALTAVQVVSAQLRCQDMAGVAARLTARGEAAATVTAAAAAAGPRGARLSVRHAGELVAADVTVEVHALGVARMLPAIVVRETAVAADESVGPVSG